jgi:hypothetical protein
VKFAIDMGFAHPAGDKLGVLGTEIEDEDFFAVDVLVHGYSVKLATIVWMGKPLIIRRLRRLTQKKAY